MPYFANAQINESRHEGEPVDVSLLYNMFNYCDSKLSEMDSMTVNTYVKATYRTKRRNWILMLIPTMYDISRGHREYIYESYGRITFFSDGNTKSYEQVKSSTIRHYHRSMSHLSDYLAVRLYAPTLLPNHLLSPFSRTNRKFYTYRQLDIGGGQRRIRFIPHSDNTQLVRGYAVVDSTGRIVKTAIDGEYDMVHFHINTEEQRNSITGTFKFLGNDITAKYTGLYDLPKTLADSVSGVRDKEMMDSLRPEPLTAWEQNIYDTKASRSKSIKKSVSDKSHALNFLQDVGGNLISSVKAGNDYGDLSVSPLINPQYLSYSHTNGLSYKMRLRGDYHLRGDSSRFTMNSVFGYNFRQHRFYFTIPLRYYYMPNNRGYIEMVFGNGNRISHYSIEEKVKTELGDTAFINGDFTHFNDLQLSLLNRTSFSSKVSMSIGVVFHHRTAASKNDLRHLGMRVSYNSFAPMIAIQTTPFNTTTPLLTLSYERGIRHLFESDMSYGKLEFDASFIHHYNRMRKINVRFGGGFYTDKYNVLFVDYDMFRSNNLPQGWDDDWSGQFQLLNNRWYNMSPYYLRGNISFESPMVLLSWVPHIGHFIELERIYVSNVLLEHTRPYFELGYGFTCRAFSVAWFTSFLNTQFQRTGIEFTFELFRRW